MLALYALAYAFGLTYATWILYLAVMNLDRAKRAGTLSPTAFKLGMPLLIVGYLLDFLLNATVLTFVLVELPRETTVTSRLKRHHKTSAGWRLAVVLWLEPLLDPFCASGDHI